MARTRGDKDAQEHRGAILRKIRETHEASQDDFATMLNERAVELKLPVRYKHYTVSRIEAGAVSFEDAVVWLSFGSKSQDLRWFIFEPYRHGERLERESAKAASARTRE